MAAPITSSVKKILKKLIGKVMTRMNGKITTK
jgi:hypothetical protein